MGSTGSGRLVRFGEFEIDERAGELRKEGIKVRLQEQPLQILQILLEHPGEVVTREELRKACDRGKTKDAIVRLLQASP